jgi:hypothetical protein
MLEVLTLIALIVVAVSLVKQTGANPTSDEADGKARPATQRAAQNPITPAPRAELTVRNAGLGVDSTHAVPRDSRFTFVSGFGLRPEQLKELHIYAVAGQLEEFPLKVVSLLHKLYNNGFAVGEEIMAVLHHGRPLKEGEAIYVAVARDDSANVTRTVAFLDRRRAC